MKKFFTCIITLFLCLFTLVGCKGRDVTPEAIMSYMNYKVQKIENFKSVAIHYELYTAPSDVIINEVSKPIVLEKLAVADIIIKTDSIYMAYDETFTDSDIDTQIIFVHKTSGENETFTESYISYTLMLNEKITSTKIEKGEFDAMKTMLYDGYYYGEEDDPIMIESADQVIGNGTTSVYAGISNIDFTYSLPDIAISEEASLERYVNMTLSKYSAGLHFNYIVSGYNYYYVNEYGITVQDVEVEFSTEESKVTIPNILGV